MRSSPFGEVAAEPKSESTYWQFTLNVISRELGLGNVYVCACWGWRGEGVGVRNYNVLVGEGRGESKDYVILLYQR